MALDLTDISEVETNYDKSAARITTVFFADNEVEARRVLERILVTVLEDEDVISVAGDLIRNED